MLYRNRVLGLLSLLTVITYLNRVCISVAGPRIQADLHLGPAAWGWITGIFVLSYTSVVSRWFPVEEWGRAFSKGAGKDASLAVF